MDKIKEKEGKPLICLTNHPGFIAVCKKMSGPLKYEDAYEGPRRKKFHHLAYRQFVQWSWYYLGRYIRVALRSCVGSSIRAHFRPSGDE